MAGFVAASGDTAEVDANDLNSTFRATALFFPNGNRYVELHFLNETFVFPRVETGIDRTLHPVAHGDVDGVLDAGLNLDERRRDEFAEFHGSPLLVEIREADNDEGTL